MEMIGTETIGEIRTKFQEEYGIQSKLIFSIGPRILSNDDFQMNSLPSIVGKKNLYEILVTVSRRRVSSKL